MKNLIFPLAAIFSQFTFAQAYLSYFTGDTSDVTSSPVAGTVLMGGATENDNAI